MEVFEAPDYREFLRAQISAHRHTRGYQTLLAEAAGCQRSYISQVLHSHVHLTPDHAARLAAFWELKEDETDCLLELVTLERAASETLRKISHRRLTALRARRQSVSRRADVAKAAPEQIQAVYYSSWHWTAVHMLVLVPGFTTPEAIAKRLNLSRETVEETLRELERGGILEQRNGRWAATQTNLHLTESSPFLGSHHLSWRARATDSIQKLHGGLLHYTGVYSISRKDAEKIKTITTDAISEGRKVAAASPEEELFCLNVDLFRA